MTDVNQYIHVHKGGAISQAYIGSEFDHFKRVQLVGISLTNNFANITAAFTNNILDVGAGQIVVPDGQYSIDRLNDVILGPVQFGNYYEIQLATSGLAYALYQYASESDRSNQTGGTEVPNFANLSTLNAEIADNRINPDRIKLRCNLLRVQTNENANESVPDEYEIIPIPVDPLEVMYFTFNTP